MRVRNKRPFLPPPSVLYPSKTGQKLLDRLAGSFSYDDKVKKTTTPAPPPQPVLWFPDNNADCGGSTKGMVY